MRQITEAVEALEAAGEAVTTKSVRARIGSGSFTTVGKLLREHHEEREALSPAPDHIRCELTRTADQIWTRALEEAALRHEGERRSLLARAEEAERGLVERDEEIERLETLQARLEAEAKRVKQKAVAVQQEASAGHQELQRTRQQLSSEKARADTLERLWQGGAGKEVT